MAIKHRPKTARRRFLSAGAGVALLASTFAGIPAMAEDEAAAEEFTTLRIALGGDGVFPNYRIPAIIQLNNGDLLISYDGRPTGADSPGPNSILQRRSTDGGKTWEEQTVVHAGKTGENKLGYSDPSYVYDAETNTLFNFHVFSKDQGFWGSVYGNDDEDRDVISAEVSVSTDNGVTWEHRLITDVVKPENMRGQFATSGHGIQITRGEYAGRLVQQYAGQVRSGAVVAYSVYSDDHGKTWQMGEPVGSLMDENKVVELSDGRLMMNSRAHRTHTARWVAYSDDGGHSWSEPELDHTLLDPRNNASIIQMNPGAEAGSLEAKELLFSNANATSRTNGTVRYSCDDGQTWPVSKTYEPGSHSYSDLVALADGTYGVVYEGANSEILYGDFDEDWLKPFCASFADTASEGNAGDTVPLTVTVNNDDDKAMPAGTVTADLGSGWSATEAEFSELAPGESVEVTLDVDIPIWTADGQVQNGDILISAGEYSLRGDATVTVLEGAAPTLGANIEGYPGDSTRDVAVDPYTEGERLNYHFRVDSESNVTQTTYPTAGDFYPFVPDDGAGNCRYRTLPAGAGYTCTTAFHMVNADELAHGFFLPTSTWAVEGAGLEPLSLDIVGDEVDLIERLPEVTIALSVASIEDVDGDGYDSAGDIVSYDATVTNTGNVRLTDVTGAIEAAELGSEESLSESRTYTLTEDDITAESATLSSSAAATNGSLSVSADAEPAVVELEVEPAPEPEPTGNVFFLYDSWESETHDVAIAFGREDDQVFAGDWDGNGTDTLGVRRGHTFYLNNELVGGNADHEFKYGRDNDEILVGDWDGDGTDTLGVRRGHTIYLNNELVGGNADHEFKYGRDNDEILVGDWDGNDSDTFTVRRGKVFFVNNALTGGNTDIEYRYGWESDEAFAGDFNGDGTDTVTLRRDNVFLINNAHTGGNAEQEITLGLSTDTILVGDWDGDGRDTPALNRHL